MYTLIGIQPSGKLHLGNYLSTIKPALREKHLICMIAQKHALTSLPKSEVETNVKELTKELKRLGIRKVVQQDKYCLEKFWELLQFINVDTLKHEPQYKVSNKKTAGMLTYPVLMAADIMSFNCVKVIVGEDQRQHTEIYRDLCKKLGTPPVSFEILQNKKIMSCKDPKRKMSKSLGDEHCIFTNMNKKYYESKLLKHPTDVAGLKNIKLLCAEFDSPFQSKNLKETKLALADKIYKEIGK